MGTYRAVERCSNCDEVLTQHEVMYSLGTCPKCGFVTGGTVCHTVKDSVYVPSWWEKFRNLQWLKWG